MGIGRMGISMRDFEGSGFREIFRCSFVVRIIVIDALLFGLDGERLLEILIFDERLQFFHVSDRGEIVLDAFNRFEEFWNDERRCVEKEETNSSGMETNRKLTVEIRKWVDKYYSWHFYVDWSRVLHCVDEEYQYE